MPPVGELSEINHIGTEGRQDWLVCNVEANRFVGAGGSLAAICAVFQNWAEPQSHT
jgi:hypothetical protein